MQTRESMQGNLQ